MQEQALALTATIVTSYVTNNQIAADQLSILIREVYQTLASPSEPMPVVEAPKEPAVNPRKSVFPNHLVCLDCGDEYAMLKRHIMTSHGLTVDAYKAKWGLPHDYPVVAPEYAKLRSGLAKQAGLGKRG